jgi:NADH dehydrogenase FAD-containing subunit
MKRKEIVIIGGGAAGMVINLNRDQFSGNANQDIITR